MSPWLPHSRALSQVATPAVLSGSDGDNLNRPPERAHSGHDHGSGGVASNLLDLCILPAWSRSRIFTAARIIPRIFRIMDISAVTARTLRGMACVRSGQGSGRALGFVAFTMKQYVQADLEADRQVANTLAELIIGGALASLQVGTSEGAA